MDTYADTAKLTHSKDETTRALRSFLRRSGIRSPESNRGRAAFERGAAVQLVSHRSGRGRGE